LGNIFSIESAPSENTPRVLFTPAHSPSPSSLTIFRPDSRAADAPVRSGLPPGSSPVLKCKGVSASIGHRSAYRIHDGKLRGCGNESDRRIRDGFEPSCPPLPASLLIPPSRRADRNLAGRGENRKQNGPRGDLHGILKFRQELPMELHRMLVQSKEEEHRL
jgi:hypothetical protein